ncbi:hypothetical protein [Helicobacter sp. MIT 01-3238]|nr:hypothetical protein [Helicobacter sp. MIT 01-3238]
MLAFLKKRVESLIKKPKSLYKASFGLDLYDLCLANASLNG